MSELDTGTPDVAAPESADDAKPVVEHAPGAKPALGDVAIQGAKPTPPADDSIKLTRAQYDRVAKYVQEQEDRKAAAKADPWKNFDGMTEDELDALAARRLAAKTERAQQAEREKADPLAKRERELKEYEDSLREKAEKFQAERYESAVQQVDQRFEAIVTHVVAQLPEGLRGPDAQLRAIDRLAAAVDAGEDVTMEELIAHVKGSTQATGRGYVKSSEVKDLLEDLSPAQRDALRELLGAPPASKPAPVVRAGTSRSDATASKPREGGRPDAVNDAFSDTVRQITETLAGATKVVW